MDGFREGFAWAIFSAPLVSFALILLILRRYPRQAGYVANLAVLIGFVLSIWALSVEISRDGAAMPFHAHQWLHAGPLTIPFGVHLDGFTAVMLVVVTSVSLMVHFYSQAYMDGDEHYAQFFAYLSLFTASMTGLVLADNVLMLYIFWELVGICSYLLIGFWYHRPAAAAAAKKAFIVTRFGDMWFLAAVLLIWTKTGTFNIATIQEAAHAGMISTAVITLFALGVFAGAIGKSAQFPLHVWLPDAMEGPTPVSALIHAATMVAAGVYLVARLFPVFEASQGAMDVVAIVGAATAFIAATIGVVMTDIKRVLAYSTISQLGYMMLSLGVGGYVAAIFHLLNHAFFKALLFLGSGSVSHTSGTFDMRKMGGLRRAMPWTYATFVIGSLSLAGIFPFSGFWSKDEVLLGAWDRGGWVGYLAFSLGMLVVFLTAFYIFRAVFITFHGEYRGGEREAGHGAHGSGTPHESPWIMVGPLVLLAVPSVLSGFANINGGFGTLLNGALPPALREAHLGVNVGLAAFSVVVGLAGVGLAYLTYDLQVVSAEALGRTFRPAYVFLWNKWFMDELYEGILVRRVLYGGVCAGLAWFDRTAVDGAVNGAGATARFAGSMWRRVQNGQIQAYGFVLVGGAVIIAAIALLLNPVR